MEIFSKRLLLREFTESDFHLFFSVFSNEQIMKYALMDQVHQEEELAAYFKKVMQNNITVKNRPCYEFAVFSVLDERFIGFADVEILSRNQFGGSAEIGYFLLPGFWGNGYATEIANTLTEFCFLGLHLHRVTARCNANNLSSEKVMKKSGMVQEGEFRKARYKNGQWVNEKHYSILKEEWEETNIK